MTGPSPIRPASTASYSSANGTHAERHVGLLVVQLEVAAVGGAQAAGEEQVLHLGADPRRGVRRQPAASTPSPAAAPPRAARAWRPRPAPRSGSPSSRPAGISTNRCPAGWRYCHSTSTRSSSSTASTTAAPGCSSTSRRAVAPSGVDDLVGAQRHHPRRRGAGRSTSTTGQACGTSATGSVSLIPQTLASDGPPTDPDGRSPRARAQPDPAGGGAARCPARRAALRHRRSTCAGSRRRACGPRSRPSRFPCTEPGASTFVDCVATVLAASLNGVPLDLATVVDGRLPLPDLQADNVLVVSSEQLDTGSGAGILRTVDPADGLVYVWTSFEPDDARRAWACFDQPDLKAPHAFTVLAPASWTVTSNSAPGDVVPEGDDAAAGRSPTPPRCRRTSSWSTRARSRDPRGARRPQPRAVRPPVAARLPRARRPGAARAHRGRAGVLRRAVRPAVRPAPLRPGLRAQHGRRDGELGLRHLDRLGALPQRADPPAALATSPTSCCTRWPTCGSATS